MKHMKLKKNLLNRSRGGNFLVYLLLVLAGVFMALPLVYAIASSLKPFEEIFLFPPKLYVINPTLENFESLFTLSLIHISTNRVGAGNRSGRAAVFESAAKL